MPRLHSPRSQRCEVVFWLACKHGCNKQVKQQMPWNAIEAEHFEEMRRSLLQHYRDKHVEMRYMDWEEFIWHYTLDDLQAWSIDNTTQFAIPEIQGVQEPEARSCSESSRSRSRSRRGHGGRRQQQQMQCTSVMPDGFKLNSFQREVLNQLRGIRDVLEERK